MNGLLAKAGIGVDKYKSSSQDMEKGQDLTLEEIDAELAKLEKEELNEGGDQSEEGQQTSTQIEQKLQNDSVKIRPESEKMQSGDVISLH